MTTLAKPERIVDQRFLAHVRSLRCLVCSHPSPDAHHLQSRGAGGSDYTCVPLCRAHHQEYHAIGLTRFETKHHRINLWRENSRIVVGYFTREEAA